MNDMDGSVAIVTGASTGIGEATAKRFADAGASVVAADVNVEDGQATVDDIHEAGGEATFVEVDVSDAAAAETMVETAVDTYGGLDYAFNNAGIEGERGPLAEQSVENFQRVIDVNVGGVFNCMRAEIPAMLDGGGGAIVNTASIAGKVGFANISPYTASKFGVIGLTKTAALEYSGEGVRVNAVCPGVIDTPMVQSSDQEEITQIEAMTPIGRIGRPEEIGNPVVWLCSEEASFVTGEALVVDGGYISQ
jgi:NAD(P)-dependent dehydrogenase (short-subunit alcohol dehydrogenase family)